MRRSIIVSLSIIFSLAAHGLCWRGPYVGGGVGASFLSAKRTLWWDVDGLSDSYFADNLTKSGAGFDNQVFVGWRDYFGSVILGGEGHLGYGLQKQKFQEAESGDPDNIFVSNLSEKIHVGIFGMVGTDISNWGVFFKLGVVGAQIQHDYQELDAGSQVDSKKTSSFSPGLGVGLIVEKPLSQAWSLRFDYTCAFHKAVEANFRSQKDDQTVMQKAGSLRNQSVMLSAVWSLS